MGGSLNGGTQQPWVFLLKMIILGCFRGTTIYGNTHIHVPSCNLAKSACLASFNMIAGATGIGRSQLGSAVPPEVPPVGTGGWCDPGKFSLGLNK